MASKYEVGQVVFHRLFNYRGVIIAVNESFEGSDEWYDVVARSKPPKDAPWYHVLPDGATHRTYVAERNLQADDTAKPIKHELIEAFFDRFEDGAYVARRAVN